MLTFNEYIIESRGINDDVKTIQYDLIEDINKLSNKIIDDYKNNIFNPTNKKIDKYRIPCYNYNYTLNIDLSNKNYKKIKIDNVSINLNVYISDNLKNFLNFSNANFKLDNMIFTNKAEKISFGFDVYLTEEFLNKYGLLTSGFVNSVNHELSHFIEAYYIEYNSRKYPKNYNYDVLYKQFKKDLTAFEMAIYNELFYRIYLSFDHELNAVISETYSDLYNSEIVEYDLLVNMLLDCKSYNKMLYLKSFNPNKFINDLYDNYYDKELIFDFINVFIENMKPEFFKYIKFPKTKVLNRNDLNILLKCFNNYFNNKAEYAIRKMCKIVSEVYDDKNKLQ